jgi:hypothetical protein
MKDVIARGNQISETAASAVRSVSPPNREPLAALAQYYKRVAPIVATEVKRPQALPRPSRDRALLNRYLAAITSSASYTLVIPMQSSRQVVQFEPDASLSGPVPSAMAWATTSRSRREISS